MEHRGLQRYLIEIGGEIRASGLNKNHRPWLVAIERPSLMITGAQIILGLENVSVATSGVYRNFVTIEDRSYPHILNPKTGYPIPLSVVSASVIVDHKNAVYPITEASRYHAAIADGLATAVVVVGAERALQIAEQHQVGLYLLVYQGSQINPILTTENTRPMWNKAFERVALSCPLSEIWTTSVALR